jgi:hypothetical protein
MTLQFVFVCFVDFCCKTGIIALNCIMEKCCVSFEVRSEILKIIQMKFGFSGLMWKWFLAYFQKMIIVTWCMMLNK